MSTSAELQMEHVNEGNLFLPKNSFFLHFPYIDVFGILVGFVIVRP